MSQATYRVPMPVVRDQGGVPALLWILLAATAAASVVVLWTSLHASQFGDLLTYFTT